MIGLYLESAGAMLRRKEPMVRPSGGRVASVMTRSIFAAGMDGLRPRPALSLRPSSPKRSKRFDHIDTVGIDVFIRPAASSNSSNRQAATGRFGPGSGHGERSSTL